MSIPDGIVSKELVELLDLVAQSPSENLDELLSLVGSSRAELEAMLAAEKQEAGPFSVQTRERIFELGRESAKEQVGLGLGLSIVKQHAKRVVATVAEAWENDIGIDFGTTNTLIYAKNQGIVLREPSVVAFDHLTRQIRAVGDEAKRVLDSHPKDFTAIRPMKDGVITDFDVTEAMLHYFMQKASGRSSAGPPRVVIAIPSGITEDEKRAVKDSAIRAGAREVMTIPEPMAAALGVGLRINEPSANMIVDIGGGTTEIAIISLNGIVFSKSIRVGGDELDHAIMSYMKCAYNLLIGERTAEEIKMRIGSAYPLEEELALEVKGRDSSAGVPEMVHITSQEIREALAATIGAIVDAVRITLERCPPELAGDLVARGFVLSGGGALIRGIDSLLTNKTGLPVAISEDPLAAVANGTGAVLEDLSRQMRHLSPPSRSA